MDFYKEFQERIVEVNKALDKFNEEKDNPQNTIYKAMNYSLHAGGKRVRPVIMMAVAELMGASRESVMPFACAAADVVISRSGASSISELCAAHKAAIFVPSPNVTEDHQTHNAMALVNKEAGLIVKDSEAAEKLMATACELIENPEKIALIEKNVAALAKSDAAMTIAEHIYKTIR